jgi:anti-sigma regulatory factor (Ser/Thr protein kinase)
VNVGPETLVIRAEFGELKRVVAWTDRLARAWNLPSSTLFAIQLCFEEAVSNIIRHGFPDGPGEVGFNRDVRLSVERRHDAAIITVADFAAAFDPLGVVPRPRAATIEEAVVGGHGIQLMRQFAQHLAYEHKDGMNRLTLGFDLTSSGT